MSKIALYKGGLHKVIRVPRRWPLTKPTISLALFRKGLIKREQALLLAGKNDDLEDNQDGDVSKKRKRVDSEDGAPSAKHEKLEDTVAEEQSTAPEEVEEEDLQQQQIQPQEEQPEEEQQQEQQAEKEQQQEVKESVQLLKDERAKRKAELEDRLRTLTTEKHRLVQLLKQIIVNEEESKKKVQGTTPLPSTNATPKPTEATTSAPSHSEQSVRPMDLEEGELDDGRTPSPQSKTLSTTKQVQPGSASSSRLGHSSSSSSAMKFGRVV